jgi:hypothetical protein
MSRDSSVGIASRLRAARSALAVNFSLCHRIQPSSLLSNGSGAISLAVKREEREAENSPPSSAEVKHTWSCTAVLPIRLHSAVLC